VFVLEGAGLREPLIKSVMTPFPYYVDLDDRLGQARKMMLEHRVHHLPVMHDHELKGIVTDRDIKLLLGPELGSPDPHTLTVEDAYIDDCYTVSTSTALVTVLRELAERHIGAALVTREGRLAGIFTAADACRAYADELMARYHPANDDPDA
jgi:acetoin utilization protein AcuB